MINQPPNHQNDDISIDNSMVSDSRPYYADSITPPSSFDTHTHTNFQVSVSHKVLILQEFDAYNMGVGPNTQKNTDSGRAYSLSEGLIKESAIPSMQKAPHNEVTEDESSATNS